MKPFLPALLENGKIPSLYFRNQGLIHDHPIVVYADFETYQNKLTDVTRGTHTKVLASMNGAASFGFYAVSSIPSIPSHGSIERGTADEFIKQMLVLALRYRHVCRNPVEMKIRRRELEEHKVARKCYMCGRTRESLEAEMKGEKNLTEEEEMWLASVKSKVSYSFVKDHDHITGRFRGSSCFTCNLKAQMPKQVIVFFHNLESFDGHLLIEAIMRLRAHPTAQTSNENDSDDDEDLQGLSEMAEYQDGDDYETGVITLDWKRISRMRFDIIANTSEKYMQITLGPLVFRDSFKFKDVGLANLIKGQRKPCKDGKTTLSECFPILAANHPFLKKFPGDVSLDLILQKVPMAYTAITDSGYFDLPTVLPQEAYDNDLSGEPCSDKDFKLVGTVAQHFDLKDQGEYHDLYLWTDVLALWRPCAEDGGSIAASTFSSPSLCPLHHTRPC